MSALGALDPRIPEAVAAVGTARTVSVAYTFDHILFESKRSHWALCARYCYMEDPCATITTVT